MKNLKMLPSDTDIDIEKRNNVIVQNEDDAIYIKNGDCFEAGAKWMREKINIKAMELKNFLIEALKERFKANATVEAIGKEIELIAENKTFEKYKTKILLNDEMEFELVGVRAHLWTFISDIKMNKVDLRLAYFCKSKLPKEKREKLEQVKLEYIKNKYLKWNNYETPIWKELCYSVELENVLCGNINLGIK